MDNSKTYKHLIERKWRSASEQYFGKSYHRRNGDVVAIELSEASKLALAHDNCILNRQHIEDMKEYLV